MGGTGFSRAPEGALFLCLAANGVPGLCRVTPVSSEGNVSTLGLSGQRGVAAGSHAAK